MKLLLDEHYSKEIADRLRTLGHDAICVTQRSDLRGRSDGELLERAASERRAIVTENAGDFMPLVHRAAREGKSHHGVVLTSSRSMPRSPDTIGPYVEALAALLEAHPTDDAFVDRVHWLTPPNPRP